MSTAPGAGADADRFISREGGFLAVEAWFRTTGKGVILSYQNAQYGYGGNANMFTLAGEQSGFSRCVTGS